MPAQALRLQRGVDLVFGVGPHRDQYVGRSSHCGNGRSPLGQRSPVGNADEVFLEQRLALDVAGRVRKDAERQVDFPVGQLRQHGLAAGLADGHVYPRRLGAQLPQQRRQQQVGRIVGQRHAKAAHGSRGVEFALVQQRVELPERRFQRLLQFPSAWCQAMPPPWRISRGSWKMSRSCASAWLTAGWLLAGAMRRG